MQKLNIIASGIFHYRYYVESLAKCGLLDHFYFSHKVTSLKGMSVSCRTNIFPKEYLMYVHIRLFGAASAFRCMEIYNSVWRLGSLFFFTPAEVNIVLLQGNCLDVMRRAKSRGCVVVGEAVNIHPFRMRNVMQSDTLYHGVKFFWSERIYKRKLLETKLIDYLLAPSKTVADSYIAEGFPADKVIVIPYGTPMVETPPSVRKICIFKDTDLLPTINVVCVAQVFPRKGQFHLLKAISQYVGTVRFEVTFVGTADPSYINALSELGVSYLHIKALPHSKVLELMMNADVVCLNSLEDGFGMVVTEAISVGTPVAVSKYAGASEVVSRCGGGIVYDPLDYPETIEALINCASGGAPLVSQPFPTWSDYSASLSFEIAQILAKR